LSECILNAFFGLAVQLFGTKKKKSLGKIKLFLNYSVLAVLFCTHS